MHKFTAQFKSWTRIPEPPLPTYRVPTALPYPFDMAFKTGGKNSHKIPELEGN